MLTTLALTFVVNLATTGLRWLTGKIGRVPTQILVFIFAGLGALYLQFHTQFPSIENLVSMTLVIFSSAVALYEVILKYIPGFAGPSDTPPVD